MDRKESYQPFAGQGHGDGNYIFIDRLLTGYDQWDYRVTLGTAADGEDVFSGDDARDVLSMKPWDSEPEQYKL